MTQFAFSLAPHERFGCPATLRRALSRIARTHGEQCPGRLDAQLLFSAESTCGAAMPAPEPSRVLLDSGFPLSHLADCMGQSAPFIELPEDWAPYCQAWAAFERLSLDFRTRAPGPEPTRRA